MLVASPPATTPRFASPAEWARRLTFATAGGLFMGATGGFGTFVASPLAERLLGWLVMFWFASVLFTLTVKPAITLGFRWGLPLWFSVAALVTLASVPMTAVSFLATTRIMHTGHGQPWLNRYLEVLLVAGPAVGGWVALRTILDRAQANAVPAPVHPAQSPAGPHTEPPPRPIPFMARLPARLGGDLLCLEMEDHYVRAHTPLGSELILMRMRDAVAELDGLEGMQTHRSWWVARSAVEQIRREGNGLRLQLRGGIVAPVARAAAAKVRAAGWRG